MKEEVLAAKGARGSHRRLPCPSPRTDWAGIPTLMLPAACGAAARARARRPARDATRWGHRPPPQRVAARPWKEPNRGSHGRRSNGDPCTAHAPSPSPPPPANPLLPPPPPLHPPHPSQSHLHLCAASQPSIDGHRENWLLSVTDPRVGCYRCARHTWPAGLLPPPLRLLLNATAAVAAGGGRHPRWCARPAACCSSRPAAVSIAQRPAIRPEGRYYSSAVGP